MVGINAKEPKKISTATINVTTGLFKARSETLRK
jgi:hypothetical protein